TLGFRGEALPTIASVSRLLLESRDPAEAEGTRVEFANGKLVSVKPAGLAAGTTVSVADLFFSVPARRKFLKSDTTELGHIASLVTHYALANPDKQFVLTTPAQTIIDCAPAEKVSDRVYQLFGRQSLAELLEIPPFSAPFRAVSTEPPLDPEEESATLAITGFTSRPEIQRTNASGIYSFVNKRLVRDKLLLHAIHEAYRNIHPHAISPATLLFLAMPYDEVDVNVHPKKIEVRFRHSQFVHDAVRDAIRRALMAARPIASFAVATGTAPVPHPSPSSDAQTNSFHPASPAPVQSGIPPAVIPTMREAGVGSSFSLEYGAGVGSENSFDLSPPQLQPVERRFAFDHGTSFASGAAAVAAAPSPDWMGNLAGPSSDAPA